MDLTLSIRIDTSDGRRFGPGKAAILEAVNSTGSIAGAARMLRMSYPRALKLVESMNTMFASPVIISSHGGTRGGGATLTKCGLEVLNLYKSLCRQAMGATNNSQIEFKALIGPLDD